MVIAMYPSPLPEPCSPVLWLSLHWQGLNCQMSCWGMILWGYTINSVERKIRKHENYAAVCLKRVYSAQLHLQFLPWSVGTDEMHRDSGLSCFGPEIWEENSQIRLSRRGNASWDCQPISLLAESRHLVFVDEIIDLIDEWLQCYIYSSTLNIS